MHCCNLLSFSIAIKKKNSFRFLLNFIWKTSPRKRLAPKEVPPSLCIFIAVSVQALYCKHRQERKGNKKAELAMISSTSMHWRELYRVELRQGGQTNKEAVTPQAVSHRLATNAQTRHKFRTFQMRMKLFGLIYSTACPCRTSCNFYTNNVHLWTGTQSYREPLCIQKIFFFFPNMEDEKENLWSSSLKYICQGWSEKENRKRKQPSVQSSWMNPTTEIQILDIAQVKKIPQMSIYTHTEKLI